MSTLFSTPSSVVGQVLAHQGGWDELLMVAVPVVIFAVLLRAANRRAARLADEREPDAAVDRPTEPRNERGGPV